MYQTFFCDEAEYNKNQVQNAKFFDNNTVSSSVSTSISFAIFQHSK